MEQEYKQKPISKDYLTSSLKDFDSEVLDKKYLKSDDEQLHTHANKEVLNRLNVSDTGALLFDGNEINMEPQAIRQLIDLSYANANGYTDEKIAALINGAPSTLDTLKEIADALEENDDVVQALHNATGTVLEQKTLTAGATTLTFTSDAITDNSLIDVYTDPFCTGLKAINQDGSTLTLTFEKQSTNMRVCVKAG